jgi:hypothetical protein
MGTARQRRTRQTGARCALAALCIAVSFSVQAAQSSQTNTPTTVPISPTTPTQAATPASPVRAPVITGLDVTKLSNGGVITITGKADPGKPIAIEVWNENHVRGSYFDNKPDKEGKTPNKLYLTDDVPAFYRTLVPKSKQEVIEKYKKEGKTWSYSEALKETGGIIAYDNPGTEGGFDAYQVSMAAAMSGSRGDLLPQLEGNERKRRSMQIMKARFRSIDKLISASIDQKEDGSFTAQLKVPEGSPPGKYTVTAFADTKIKSEPAQFANEIAFPIHYMHNSGASINLFGPFFIVLLCATFGVLMGAGGGFIINPILLMFYPLPHNVVAGTVTPTVLFSQISGVTNYARIKFLSWKVGIVMGLAMVAGAFIGPALTSLITLDQFKSIFGYILFFLAALMLWQTTPGYLAKNKKEQAIMKEFQARAKKAAGQA